MAGIAFVLRIADRDTPPEYHSVAGLTATRMVLASETVTTTAQDCAGWRTLLSGAGIRELTVEAAGVVLGRAAEDRLRVNAFAGLIADYQLRFAEGDALCGKFLIRRMEYTGDHDGQRRFALVLESSGPIALV